MDPTLIVVAMTAAMGTVLVLVLSIIWLYHCGILSPSLLLACDKRRRIPQTIILIRHGESEANADMNLWKTVPDNLLGLTAKGHLQAQRVGQRVEAILEKRNCKRVHLIVSPFERTLQTASSLRPALEHRIVRTDIESRIREQEVGNLQGDEFQQFRKEQTQVGRFWYRFPTGESGADVLDRVKSWWFESVLSVNSRVGYDPVDAMVVVTHGLTMRFILMQLFGWSPTTFHSIWNAGNCDMYVLQKDLSKPGNSPYIMDKDAGDMPRSSIDVVVTLKKTKTELSLKLEDYLCVPPPRTTRIKLIKIMLANQHPDVIKDAKDIASICFMPFVKDGMLRGRSTSGVLSYNSRRSSSSINDAGDDDDASEEEKDQGLPEEGDDRLSSSHSNENLKSGSDHPSSTMEPDDDEFDDNDDDNVGNPWSKEKEGKDVHTLAYEQKRAKREVSMRFPCIQIPGMVLDDKIFE